MANLIYKTDFENIVKLFADTSSMPIPHRFAVVDGSFWMEGLDRHSGITPHSGSRCVGMEVNTSTGTGDERCEFNVVSLNSLVGRELFVRTWLYLPSDFALYEPNGWFSICDPQFEDGAPPTPYLPYWVIMISQPDIAQRVFKLLTLERDTNSILTVRSQTPIGSAVDSSEGVYPLPLGRWFNFQYYVLRSSARGVADGKLKIWIDQKVVCDLNNIVTSGGSDWFTTVAKIYGSLAAGLAQGYIYRLYQDDLEIWDGMPPVTPIPPTTHILSVNSNLSGFQATIDGQPVTIPYSATLAEGSHTVVIPSSLSVGGVTHNFVSWEDGSMSTSRTVNLTADTTITATYQPQAPPTYTLAVSLGTAGGSTSPAPGNYAFDQNASVEVSAIPLSGYSFDHWVLDGVSFASNPIIVLMSKNRSLAAYFSATPPPPPTQYSLSISVTPGGTTSPSVGVTKYNAGTAVTITAYPASGYAFQNWMIDGAPYPTNPVTVTMDMDHTVLAQFAAIPPPPTHLLSIASNLSGFYATVNGSQRLVPYSEALAEGSYALAVPSNLTVGSDVYNFSAWADGPTSPSRTVQLMADIALYASYVLQPPPPPTKGNIEVHTFLDAQEVVAPGSVVETSEAFNTPTTLPENPGIYVVKVTIGGETKQQTVTVSSEQTVRLDFQFTTLPPISPISPGLILGGLIVGGVILSSTPK